jgi:hypothetical protein
MQQSGSIISGLPLLLKLEDSPNLKMGFRYKAVKKKLCPFLKQDTCEENSVLVKVV